MKKNSYCFCTLLVLVSTFSFSSLFSQALTLPDILKIHNLDSAAAKQYCASKKLPFKTASNTGATKRYLYATADSTYRLEINYPNDSSSLNIQISYWFKNAEDYKKIKIALRKAGFRQQTATEAGGTLPPFAARYVAKNLQAELIEAQGKQPYWLFLHPKGNYNW